MSRLLLGSVLISLLFSFACAEHLPLLKSEEVYGDGVSAISNHEKRLDSSISDRHKDFAVRPWTVKQVEDSEQPSDVESDKILHIIKFHASGQLPSGGVPMGSSISALGGSQFHDRASYMPFASVGNTDYILAAVKKLEESGKDEAAPNKSKNSFAANQLPDNEGAASVMAAHALAANNLLKTAEEAAADKDKHFFAVNRVLNAEGAEANKAAHAFATNKLLKTFKETASDKDKHFLAVNRVLNADGVEAEKAAHAVASKKLLKIDRKATVGQEKQTFAANRMLNVGEAVAGETGYAFGTNQLSKVAGGKGAQDFATNELLKTGEENANELTSPSSALSRALSFVRKLLADERKNEASAKKEKRFLEDIWAYSPGWGITPPGPDWWPWDFYPYDYPDEWRHEPIDPCIIYMNC